LVVPMVCQSKNVKFFLRKYGITLLPCRRFNAQTVFFHTDPDRLQPYTQCIAIIPAEIRPSVGMGTQAVVDVQSLRNKAALFSGANKQVQQDHRIQTAA